MKVRLWLFFWLMAMLAGAGTALADGPVLQPGRGVAKRLAGARRVMFIDVADHQRHLADFPGEVI